VTRRTDDSGISTDLIAGGDAAQGRQVALEGSSSLGRQGEPGADPPADETLVLWGDKSPSAAAKRRTLVTRPGADRAVTDGASGKGNCASYVYAPKGTDRDGSNLNLEKGEANCREADGLLPPYSHRGTRGRSSACYRRARLN